MNKGADEGFWKGQQVSTNSPTHIINSNICLSDKSINKFLNQFDTQKFKTTRGYSAEQIAKRLRDDNKNTTIDILKVWLYQLRISISQKITYCL